MSIIPAGGSLEPQTDTSANASNEAQPTTPAKKEKVPYKRGTMARNVPISIVSPLLPDCQFDFVFSLAMSKDVREAREKYMGLNAKERDEKADDYILQETAGLLIEPPSGFEDWPDWSGTFYEQIKTYLNGIEDESEREKIKEIFDAANASYWDTVMPRQLFRKI